MGGLIKLPEGTELQVGSHTVIIVRYLSEGGFAHIYETKNKEPHEGEEDMACLKRVIIPDKNGLNQLRKEVEVMKVLRNGRSIVKYYDSHAERVENGAYQVLVLMELCPNKSLLDYMNAKIKTKLNEPEILKIMMDISLGVYEMHSRGMIHRDIKIENVLIDRYHNFKLCDFGSTSSPIMPPKDQQEFQVIAHDIMYQTTPQYRAPEMIDLYRYQPIDEKADIWALGCFLYKLCYYTTPFEANGDIAILHARFQFHSLPAYSGDLRNLIILMLQENPLFRPNIVQIIMILSKQMQIDFTSLNIEDVYKLGPYNFQALNAYQIQKQNEIARQQQIYYQQRALFMGSEVTNEGLSPAYHENILLPGDAVKHREASEETKSGTISTHKEGPLADSKVSDKSPDVSFSEVDNFNDIAERYPALDDLDMIEPNGDKPEDTKDLDRSSNREERTSRLDILRREAHDHQNEQNRKDFKGQKPDVQRDQSIEYRRSESQSSDNKLSLVKSFDEQYSPSKVQSHSTHTNANAPQHKTSGIYSSLNRSKSEKTRPSDFEKTEAWEKSHSNIDKNAEQLADDIFSSNIKSRSHSSKALDLDHVSQQNTQGTGKTNLSSELMFGSKSGGSKSNSLNKDIAIDVNTEDSSDDESVGDIEVFDSKDGQAKNFVPLPKEEDNVIFSQKKVPDDFTKEPGISGKYVNDTNKAEISPTLQNNMPHMHAADTNLDELQFLKSRHGNNAQQNLPLNIAGNDVRGTRNEQRNQGGNPWGDFRTKSHIERVPPNIPSADANDNTLLLQKEINDLNIGDSKIGTAYDAKNKFPAVDAFDQNLIDLNNGPEAPQAPKKQLNYPYIPSKDIERSSPDLGLDEERKVAERKPQFKKRISSIQNPSNFSFQEEIIDFASDDENPEHNSEMSRVSIRNSLKNKPRKSNEHKRTDSSGDRKRLSWFSSSHSN
ncbi:Piso0_002642 [Millerozyma farinosa CBS 7064]|uniref:Piso0_002642 protein n=1 Tax=Pichia sorbitophila (strain ATCC MYA-4447 / BCRC 22081 / CBS 7064 / NBRC 10061 / NRRL Y-12695) TaxID=559304 RepID=G8YD55_PICSO|nr:Piso0_002642 [Millerozyma farinosa CBS 7064]